MTAELRFYYERGMTIAALSRMFDTAPAYVRRLLIRDGVQMRPAASETTQRRPFWGGMNDEQRRAYDERLRNTKR